MDEFDGIRSFFPRPVEAVLDDVVGFFKGSSADCFVDFDLAGCRTVDRIFFGTGPASSADERGREVGGWTLPDVEGCRLGR